MTYPQIKVLSNTSETEVNLFIFDNKHLSPVIISAQTIALPGRSNMLVPQLVVVVQLLIAEEVVEIPGVEEAAVVAPIVSTPTLEKPKVAEVKVETPKA